MIVVIPEIVSCEIFLNGYIEEGLTRMILEYLKCGMTFFDIGAHFGYYTLLGSTIVGESGRVHSFEPTLSTYKILLDNMNGRNNIVVNNVALFSRNTTILFYDYGNEYAALNSFTRPRLDQHIIKEMTSTKVEVKAVSLDEYVYNKSIKPDFIKIDAESAEYEILKGMAKTIADFRPIISLEVGDMNIPNVKSSQEIILHLIQNGYEAYEYKNGNIVKHHLRERYGYDNILFLPK